ncbi:MAG: 3-hydroxyacyl-CoA dehydrogenase/enoyl-CoA hydratase family protein, partial [Terriglobales bacterium]
LQRVAVLGAGTMGARLAAHCANHGLETTLLDLSREQAERGLKAATQSRPAAFFLPGLAASVRLGSFGEDLGCVREADWVVEAVVEDLAAKRALLAQLAPRLGAETALSTNTSGLPVAAVGAELPAALRRRWLGTHFFNPPRYMRLAEVIPTAETDPEVMAWLRAAIELRLGKGTVVARDTPNFIANRIGLFALLNTVQLMQALHLSVEEVDALTGPLLGWPKSATFRTLDMIGLDTLVQVVRNSYANLEHDEQRELFRVPAFIEAMVARGWLGEKSGQGFYQRRDGTIWALDLETMEYHPRRSVRLPFETLAAARQASPFVEQSLDGLFRYCAARLGEITDDREAVNRAMRWGYNWQFGPFELQAMLADGKPADRSLAPAVRANPGCSLLDLGEGVGCLEFHTKLNAIGADTVRMVTETLADPASGFDAFVISNGAENFSAGADLLYLLALIQNEEWEEVEEAVRRFQAMTMAVKRSPRPVVVAPFGMTLGGGCELMLHAAQVVAHAELYAGLVEVGVGLIPAGGGTKEMALRADPKTALETIALAKVSTSAAEARQLRLLRRGDAIVANRDRVLETARRAARRLADAGYEPPAPATLTAPGPSVQSTLELGVYLMREAEQITEFEQTLGRHLIRVICAGGAPAGMAVPEAQLLDLEREAFLSLCGEARTQERIAHMLKTGKALRN